MQKVVHIPKLHPLFPQLHPQIPPQVVLGVDADDVDDDSSDADIEDDNVNEELASSRPSSAKRRGWNFKIIGE